MNFLTFKGVLVLIHFVDFLVKNYVLSLYTSWANDRIKIYHEFIKFYDCIGGSSFKTILGLFIPKLSL